MKALNLVLLITLAGFAVGCSVDASITDLTVKTAPVTQYANLYEVSSGSIVATTGGGYKVTATIGNSFSSVKETSTPGGYLVYGNVQGNLASQ